MLVASLFEPDSASIKIVEFDQPLFSKVSRFQKEASNKNYRIGRLCLTAKAVDPSEANSEFVREVRRSFRNPGMQNI